MRTVTKHTRIRRRVSIAVGATVFLTLVGASGATALWTTPSVPLTASVSSGSVGINQSGFDALAVDYKPAVLSVAKPVTVTNTGTVAAPYTLTLGAQTPSGLLAAGAVVRIWPRAGGNCDTPSGTSYTWATGATQTGTLAAGASTVFCVQSSITATQQNTLATQSVVATLALSSGIGSWTSSSAASALQKVLDTMPPSTPTGLVISGTTSSQTTITWTASTDYVGVVAYDIYRDGGTTPIGTSTTPTFTDTGLSAQTTYSYTIKARDAAGNASAASTAASATTTGEWFTIKTTIGSTTYCLSAQGSNVVAIACNASSHSQQWRFLANGTIEVRQSPLFMFSANSGNNKPVTLVGATGEPTVMVVTTGTDGRITIQQGSSSGKCLDATDLTLTQRNCSTGAAGQTFTRTAVN